ncbi:putative secreted protein (Por secretion system target) [Arcicella aurantiaca]|uniref:Aminopeptidase N n=1 Tax=Arcicella aurantiaca TaxID=591202 RepID=A0A316EHI9_9BACT|nr:M1 family aminopeptidase [Arcicella aurantiaca]PWK29257.1 putative secreted protein (Por secretion system target) [Arcicella aurantiaca]
MKNLLFLSLFILTHFTIFAQISDSECAIGKIEAMQKRLQNAKLQGNQAADNNIDVSYYKLDLSIAYTTQSVKGEVTINAKSKIAELSQVTIDLQNALTTDSVKIGNSKMPYLHQSNQILINLDKKYAENQLVSLVIYYHGTPGSSGFNSFVFGTHNSQKDLAIWSLSEPYGSSDWFPCKNAVDDKADSSDVWITADKYYVSVSNGVLQKVVENQNGTKTYQWKNRYPIAQYLISIALSNYSEYKNSFKYDGVNEMPVTHFIYPESLTATNKLALDKTVFMLDLFSQKFGLYPFIKEKYGHAQFGWGGGMEHQTCTSISSFGETLIAHELTHQWFGDKITCKNWENIWLNEGFASYGECIYTEAIGGKVAYDNYIKSFMNSAKTAKGTIFVQDVNNINEIFSSSRTYRKGATVLHMLRGIVGDDVFYKILQTYISSKNAYSNATTEDFQAIAEQVYGQKLDYFFKQWIYGESYPKYKMQWSSQSQINGSYKVNLNISQTTGTNLTFFTMPIQMKIAFGLGDTTVTVFNDKASQSFEILVKDKPVNVTFDANNWILKDIETVNILANEPVFGDTFGLNVFPNPSSDEINVSYQLPKNATVRISMVDFSGKEIFKSVEEKLTQGNYSQNIKINDFPAGTYIINLNVDGQNESRKLLMVK